MGTTLNKYQAGKAATREREYNIIYGGISTTIATRTQREAKAYAAGMVTAFRMAGYFFPVRLFDSDHKEICTFNK